MEMSRIAEPITKLVFPDDSTITLGKLPGCGERFAVSIEAYEEPGGLGPIIWFHVEWNKGGFAKYNSSHVAAVLYQPTGKEK